MSATSPPAGRHALPQPRRRRTNRIAFGALVVAAAAAAGPAASATAATTGDPDVGTIAFEVSSASNRSGSRALTGATLTTDSFVFLDDSRIADADLWLDDPDRSGAPTNHESVGPFDLKPALADWARKVPVDKLAPGTHNATARLTLTDGQVVLRSSDFTVAPGAAGEPVDAPGPVESPTGSPAPSGGRPGAGNTGVPAGVALTRSGSLVIKQDGAVISGLDIRGCV
ncbi:MAG: hypothetical protein JWL64_2407, partial [Frankiales bacterium]|nr:hypothetical protein [Frankiales bacterium]